MTPSMQGSFLVDKFKPVKVKGVNVVFAGIPGRNTNVYPEDTLIEAVDYYKQLIQIDPTYKYAFAKHPKDVQEEWIGLIAGVIDEVYYNRETKTLQADFTLLPTIWGHFISWLIENNHHVGISLRGKADGRETSMEVGNKNMMVTMRSNLRLEGIDFVLYPSYIVTNVSKKNVKEQTSGTLIEELASTFFIDTEFDVNTKHHTTSAVFESYLADTSNTYGLSTEEIITLFSTNVQESTRRDVNMTPSEMELKEAQLKVERLAIDHDKLEQRKKALASEVDKTAEEMEARKQLLADLDSKISDKQQIVAGLNNMQDMLTQKQEALQKIEEQIEASNATLKQLNDDAKTVREQSDSEIFVRAAGKTFSSNKPPKIRVVPIEQRVTNVAWDTSRRNGVKQLVALSQDQAIADTVFAASSPLDSWESMMHPVYQPFASEHEDYDIDLVLNRKALQSSIDEVLGRSGLSLSGQQKVGAINFLGSKYAELEKAGIVETPPALSAAAKGLAAITKLKFDEDDDYVGTVLESAMLNGLVSVDPPADRVNESTGEPEPSFLNVQRTVAYDNLSSAIMNTLMGINKGRVQEQAAPVADEALQTFINTLTTGPDGAPTEFATTYGIETPEDFQTKFIAKLTEAVANSDLPSALGMIKTAVSSYAGAMAALDGGATGVSNHVNTAFDIIIQSTQGEAPAEPVDPAIPPMGGTEPVMEQTTLEDEMLLKDLKEIIETQFEGVKVENEADIKDVISKLISDYSSTYGELTSMKVTKLKSEKTAELIAAGVTESVIATELETVETEEEVLACADRLLTIISAQEAQKVQESSGDKAIDPVEGKSMLTKQTEEPAKPAPLSAFERAMQQI